MTDRCEPPEHLRGVDGWHWLERLSDGVKSVAEWGKDDWWSFPHFDGLSPEYVARLGWRYLAPVTPPSTVAALEAKCAQLEMALSATNEEVCQTLGQALGYPWFKDDQTNFPHSTPEDGVCVGDHVAESIAAEAARKLKTVAALVEALEGLVMACELPGDHCEREQALPAATAALALYRGEVA